MPDFVKKIEKHRSEDLLAGETLQAATIGQPPGTFSRQVGGQLGGAVGMLLAKKAGEARRPPAENTSMVGLAASIPATGPLVLAVTDRRMLFFAHGAMSGNPKELEAAIALPDVEAMSIEKHKMTSTLTIRFSDNTERVFECVRMAKPEPFLMAFNRLKGNRAA